MDVDEKMQKKLRKRKKSKAKAGILMFFVVLLILVVVAFYQYQPPENPEPIPANEYFELFDVHYLGFPILEGSVLSISELQFKIRAIEGDAHNVYVLCGTSDWEMVGSDGYIPKGEVETAYIPFSSPFNVPITGEEFPLEIQIASTEAEGEILVYVPIV